MTSISTNSVWKKVNSFKKRGFYFFKIVNGGGFDPQPPREYTTAYMPLKETPIYLLLHNNRNDKNAIQATATVTSQSKYLEIK